MYMEKFEAAKQGMQNGNETDFEASKLVTFAAVHPIYQTDDEVDLLNRFAESYKFLQLYQGEGLKMVSILDLMTSLPCNLIQNQYLYSNVALHVGRIHGVERGDFHGIGYFDFCQNLLGYLEYYKHIYDEEITIAQLLNTEFFPLNAKDLELYIAKLEMYRKLKKYEGDSFASVEALEDKCYQMQDVFKMDVNYFQRLINYLNALKRLFEFHSTKFEFSPNSLLSLDLDQIIGEIVNVEKVPPMEIEDYVVDLGKNLVHILINFNLCPKVLQRHLNITEEQELLEDLHSSLQREVIDAAKYDTNEKTLQMESSYLLVFIERNNTLAAQLIREVHNIGSDCEVLLNIDILRRFASLDQIKMLSKIFMNNPMLATLNYDNIDFRLLHKYLLSTASCKDSIAILDSINELQYKTNQIQLDKIKDIFVMNLIDASEDEKDFEYMCRIVNFNLKLRYMQKHFYKIKDSRLVRRLLQDLLSESHDKCLMPSYANQIKDWLFELDIYEAIANVLDDLNWLQVRTKSINDPEVILNELFDNVNEMKLVIPNWIKLHPLDRVSLFEILFIYFIPKRSEEWLKNPVKDHNP